jgi:hypothetical protein
VEPKFQLAISKIEEVSKENSTKFQIACKSWLLYSPMREPASFQYPPHRGMFTTPVSKKKINEPAGKSRFPYWFLTFYSSQALHAI